MNKPLVTLAIVLLIAPVAHAGLDEGVAARDRGDYATALREFTTLAEQGNAQAQAHLGLMYTKGQGVPHNFAEGLKWYRKAAEQGVAEAQYFVGVVYAQGHGVHHDDVEAVKWYRKAAEQNHASAQFNLGLMYEYGWGVLQDLGTAYQWYYLAAAQGDEQALDRKNSLDKRMTPEDLSTAGESARAWTPCGSDRPCP